MNDSESTIIKEGYRKTESGVIPDGWILDKLSNIAPLQRGFDLPTSKLKKGPYPVVYSNGILNFHNQSMAKAPGVVTGRSGTIGKVNYIEKDYWPHNTTLWVNDFNGNDEKYIYFLYSSLRIERFRTGSGVPTLNRNYVHEFQIVIPKMKSEQKAIARVLSDTDALIESLEKLIAKKKAIKQGAMQQLLTGKKRLPGFTEEWETKELGNLLKYEQPTKYIVKNTDYNNINYIPVLTAGKSFILGYTNEDYGIYFDIPVIIFDDFTTESKYVTFPFKVKSSAMKILKPRDINVNLRFIYEKMQTIDFLLRDHKRYWISEYQNIKIKIPEFKEQTSIANILSDMDAEIEKLKQKKDKYISIKQGMMQKLLTGKIRLVKNGDN